MYSIKLYHDYILYCIIEQYVIGSIREQRSSARQRSNGSVLDKGRGVGQVTSYVSSLTCAGKIFPYVPSCVAKQGLQIIPTVTRELSVLIYKF